MNPLLVSLFLLITAIAIGLYLVFLGLHRQKRAPGLGFTHAGFALAGIMVLFVQIFTGPTDRLNNLAALFLVFAVVGGGMVFALREENKPPSMVAVAIHAVMGLLGVSTLVINLF